MVSKSGGPLSWVAYVLVVIGGLNLGLTGIGALVNGNLNVLNRVFGSVPALEGIIYVLIGLSAVWLFFSCKPGRCGTCGSSQSDLTQSGSMQ